MHEDLAIILSFNGAPLRLGTASFYTPARAPGTINFRSPSDRLAATWRESKPWEYVVFDESLGGAAQWTSRVHEP
jgi:hypothetical protein